MYGFFYRIYIILNKRPQDYQNNQTQYISSMCICNISLMSKVSDCGWVPETSLLIHGGEGFINLWDTSTGKCIQSVKNTDENVCYYKTEI